MPALSARQVAVLHRNIGRAYDHVAAPVTFETPAQGAVDPLYREALPTAGSTTAWPPIKAVIHLRPRPELLTQFGLLADTDAVLVIPRQYVLDWELEHDRVWSVNSTLSVQIGDGVRRHLTEARPDTLGLQGGAADWTVYVIGCSLAPRLHTRF